jgi:hypothetical protein
LYEAFGERDGDGGLPHAGGPEERNDMHDR